MKNYFRIVVLLASTIAFQAPCLQVNAQSDEIGMTESQQETLVGFGELLDFIPLFELLEDAVEILEGLVSQAWDTISPIVTVVTDTVGDVISAISSMDAFQVVLDGLESTLSALSTTVSALEGIVDAIESAIPWMALNEDDAELSDIGDFETVSDLPDEPNGGFEAGEFDDLIVVLPQVDDAGNPSNLMVLTNPNASLTGAAASFYSESSTGNPWGDIWVNPTIIDPVFQGNIHGLEASDIGLGQINNTSDLDKPISTALEEALNSKIQITIVAPESNTSPCAVGQVFTDEDYFYVCVAPNAWSRTNLEGSW